jgi:hypothetical protein
MQELGLRKEYVDVDFKAKLEKDLSENEVICDDCGGAGFMIDDRPFGIKGYKDPQGAMFPFKKQTLTFCPSCYNGVRKKCEHCESLLPRHINRCECETAKNERAVEQNKKEFERWSNATKINLKEALENYGILYVDSFDEFISTDEFEDRLEDLLCDFEDDNGHEFDKSMLRIYVTSTTALNFDAVSIIEHECDDLHEEAYERINCEQINELQEMLNKWSETVKTDTLTYHRDYKVGVVIK